jgi:hypothetical protein
MNHRELDRLLCERLGIAGEENLWRVGGDSATGTDSGYEVHREIKYPALSTTGDGMVRLMDALGAYGYKWRVEHDGQKGPVASVRRWPENWASEPSFTAAVLPTALALAAATALQIEVPE